jgi:hypothetical protein
MQRCFVGLNGSAARNYGRGDLQDDNLWNTLTLF